MTRRETVQPEAAPPDAPAPTDPRQRKAEASETVSQTGAGAAEGAPRRERCTCDDVGPDVCDVHGAPALRAEVTYLRAALAAEREAREASEAWKADAEVVLRDAQKTLKDEGYNAKYLGRFQRLLDGRVVQRIDQHAAQQATISRLGNDLKKTTERIEAVTREGGEQRARAERAESEARRLDGENAQLVLRAQAAERERDEARVALAKATARPCSRCGAPLPVGCVTWCPTCVDKEMSRGST